MTSTAVQAPGPGASGPKVTVWKFLIPFLISVLCAETDSGNFNENFSVTDQNHGDLLSTCDLCLPGLPEDFYRNVSCDSKYSILS